MPVNLNPYIKPLTELFKAHELYVVNSVTNSSSLSIRIAGDSILVPCKTRMSWEEFTKAYYGLLDQLKENIDEFCRNDRTIARSGLYRDQETGDINFSFTPAFCITKDIIRTTDFFDFGPVKRLQPLSSSKKLELASWLEKRGYTKDTAPITKKEKEEHMRETVGDRYITPDDILKFRKDNAKVIVCCYSDGTDIETYSTTAGWKDLEVDRNSALVWLKNTLFTLEPEERTELEKNGVLLRPVRL